MTAYRVIGVSFGAWVLSGSSVLAEAPRTMTLVDLLDVPRVSEPQLSPDGAQVLYVRSDADWNANRGVSHIWRVNRDGSGSVQLTTGVASETSPRWAPAGNTLAFLSTRNTADHTQIYLLDNRGGEARQLTRHPTAVTHVAWSSDGAAMYFLATDEKTDAWHQRENTQDDVYAFEENFEHRHLWTVRVSDGTTTRVTDGDYSVLSYELSADGRQLAVHRAPNPVLEYRDASEVWVMDVDGANASRVTSNGVSESRAQISPDGSEVLFLSRSSAVFEKYYNRNLFVAPIGDGAPRLLAGQLPYEFSDARWSADGTSIFVVANMGVHSELMELDAETGVVRQLTDGQHAIGAWNYVSTLDEHVLILREPVNPGDVWVMAEDASSLTQVTRVFAYLENEFRLPRQEKTEWAGEDGVTVEGLVFYPLDYVEGERYPLVIQTHGGPQASDKFGFGASRNSIQVLTALGYVVLQPNYRGSTGYGDTFLRDMVGGYFTNAHLDVIGGADHLIDIGLVDGGRMAKMGWSGGGHMTNKVITYTNRFKAAASGAGAANWVSMYAQSDTRSQRTPWFGATPWQVDAPIDLYWEHSPLKYVSNVTTPTIFLVGEDDLRVPMPQSVEMHRALNSLDVPTHLYVAPREGHGWSELRHQLFKMNVELDWFERYVTKRDYTWERAPGTDETEAPAPSNQP